MPSSDIGSQRDLGIVSFQLGGTPYTIFAECYDCRAGYLTNSQEVSDSSSTKNN